MASSLRDVSPAIRAALDLLPTGDLVAGTGDHLGDTKVAYAAIRAIVTAVDELRAVIADTTPGTDPGGGTTTPTPTPTTPTVTLPTPGVSTPARWWVPLGQAPKVRADYTTGVQANGRFLVSWVSSMPDARAGTSLLESGVPTVTQAAWQAYVVEVATGATVADSGVQTGDATSWLAPASFVPVAGRTYKGFARVQSPDGKWSTAHGRRAVAPTGRVIYLEDYGAVPDGTTLSGTDYPAGIYQGPIRRAIADAEPGDVIRSRKRGTTLRGLTSTGTALTATTAVFTAAMVGKKICVYGGGRHDATAVKAHYTTVQAVASDGRSATLAAAVLTDQTSARVLVDPAEYVMNHIDIDGGAATTGGFTFDGTGCIFLNTREDSAGFRVANMPDIVFLSVHQRHMATTRRGNGKNNNSGTFFIEGAGSVGGALIDCYAERSRDAGFLFYSGPTDWYVVDCKADHTMADPFHVTDTANDIFFIRPEDYYCGDDLGVIGYRSGGDSKRPYNIVWENPRRYGQDWGRGLAYGGCHDCLATDLYFDGGAMASLLIGSDGDQANTENVQVRRGVIKNSRARVGMKPTYSQGASTTTTITDSMWAKFLVNQQAAGGTFVSKRQAGILVEDLVVTDGNFLQFVQYNGGAFDDASTILRGIRMDGTVNAGTSWVDQSTYANHIDLRGITPVGSTAITAAPSAANGTPPGGTSSSGGGTTPPTSGTGTQAAPTGFAAARTSSAPTQAVLTWTKASAATGYELRRAVQGQSPVVIATLGDVAATYTDTGLATGNGYYYELRAFHDEGSTRVTSSSVSANANRPQ